MTRTAQNPDFVLNQPAWRNAQILVAGDNFGCGSSREHAPWALLDFGIRCVISTSFADIFYNNCFKNGILPIVLPQEDVDKLMDDARRGANATVTVDLEAQEITGPDGGVIKFDIDPSASIACSTASTTSVDSLVLTEVVMDIEDKYDIEIDMNTAEAWESLKTVGDIVDVVKALVAAKT
jgi:3-isopropylmalate dehydratase small subunit